LCVNGSRLDGPLDVLESDHFQKALRSIDTASRLIPPLFCLIPFWLATKSLVQLYFFELNDSDFKFFGKVIDRYIDVTIFF
jgi:hypothetical protein